MDAMKAEHVQELKLYKDQLSAAVRLLTPTFGLSMIWSYQLVISYERTAGIHQTAPADCHNSLKASEASGTMDACRRRLRHSFRRKEKQASRRSPCSLSASFCRQSG